MEKSGLEANLIRMKRNWKHSPFFRLAPEIRQEIFKNALGGRVLKIDCKPEEYRGRMQFKYLLEVPGGIYQTPQPQVGGKDGVERLSEPLYNEKECRRWDTCPGLPSPNREKVSRNLLLTCRSIYQEVGLELYTWNTFFFTDEWATQHWLYNRLPAQIRAIRTIMTTIMLTKTELQKLKSLEKVWVPRGEPETFRVEDWIIEDF